MGKTKKRGEYRDVVTVEKMDLWVYYEQEMDPAEKEALL